MSEERQQAAAGDSERYVTRAEFDAYREEQQRHRVGLARVLRMAAAMIVAFVNKNEPEAVR